MNETTSTVPILPAVLCTETLVFDIIEWRSSHSPIVAAVVLTLAATFTFDAFGTAGEENASVLVAPVATIVRNPTEGPPMRHRIFWGFFMTAGVSSVAVAGEEHDISASGLGFMLAFDERIVPVLSLGARAAVSATFPTQWTHEPAAFDLGLQPKLWFTPPGLPRWDGYIAPLGGLSVPSVGTPPRRAYDAETDVFPGYHVGLSSGIIFPRRWKGRRSVGLLLELGYLFRTYRVQDRLIPEDTAPAGIVEDWVYVDKQLWFTVAMSIGSGHLSGDSDDR